MKLHQTPEHRDAIIATSKYLGLREVLVEKDYWLTYVLWQLSKSRNKNRVVFKGGTSLSKAFHIIKRFSEDIDLAIITRDINDIELSGNQIKSMIKDVEKDIATDPLVPEDDHYLISKGSKFRKTVYTYPTYMDGDYGQAADKLILEINSFANPHPFLERNIRSYIAEYFLEYNKDLIPEYGLESFKLNVLDITRTFAGKIMALVRASYQSDKSLDQLKDKIRHLYDLLKLLEQPKIQSLVKDSSRLFQLLQRVREDDQSNQEFQGDWSTKKLSEAIIFKDPEATIKGLGSTFRGNFLALLFDGEVIPPDEEMITKLLGLGNVLAVFDELSAR